jgi:hypothetical protein
MSLDTAAPLKPLPEPIDLGHYRIRRQARVGGLIGEYAWSRNVDELLGTHTSKWRRTRFLLVSGIGVPSCRAKCELGVRRPAAHAGSAAGLDW